MDEPRTDPRANDPVPAYVLGMELHQLRAELLAAALAWEAVARVETHPQRKAAAVAMQRVCYRAVNAANVSSTPTLSRWRRVWLALVG